MKKQNFLLTGPVIFPISNGSLLMHPKRNWNLQQQKRIEFREIETCYKWMKRRGIWLKVSKTKIKKSNLFLVCLVSWKQFIQIEITFLAESEPVYSNLNFSGTLKSRLYKLEKFIADFNPTRRPLHDVNLSFWFILYCMNLLELNLIYSLLMFENPSLWT